MQLDYLLLSFFLLINLVVKAASLNPSQINSHENIESYITKIIEHISQCSIFLSFDGWSGGQIGADIPLHLYSTSIYNKTFLPQKQLSGKPPSSVNNPTTRLLHRLRCLYIITYYNKPDAASTKQRIFSKPVEIFNKLLLQFFDYLDKLLYVQHQGPYFAHRVEIETFLVHVINSKYENFFKYRRVNQAILLTLATHAT